MNLTYLEIDHARGGYDALTGEELAAFNESLRFCWLYHDHALEGIPLTRDDIDRALACKPCRNYVDGQVKKSLRRLNRAFEYIDEQARQRVELSVDWLRDLHTRLCDDEDAAGEFRERNTSPGVYNLKIVDSSELDERFEAFIDTYREEFANYHPVRAAALAHWEFMRLFPFDEKTGMVGRLMMNFLLLREDYPPATIHARDRHHYFQALRGHRSELVPVIVDAVRTTISAAEEFEAACAETHQPLSRRSV